MIILFFLVLLIIVIIKLFFYFILYNKSGNYNNEVKFLSILFLPFFYNKIFKFTKSYSKKKIIINIKFKNDLIEIF